MPQNPYVRRKQKQRARKKLAAWREKQQAQQADKPAAKKAEKKS